MSHAITRISDALQNVKTDAKQMVDVVQDEDVKYVDVEIQFIGAKGLPRMDVGPGQSSDPYFVANIDDQISFVSTVVSNNLSPVWNEQWFVKNVPSHATLHVQVFDKDNGAPRDDFIGKFQTSVSAGTKEAEIEDPTPQKRPYTFNGPIRFSRHFSPTVGLFTNIDHARLYSTWKIYLRAVPIFFHQSQLQHWNRDYKAAQSIFSSGPTSLAVRSGIQAGHRLLYARTTTNDFGILSSKSDVIKILHGEIPTPNINDESGQTDVALERRSKQSRGKAWSNRVKPAVYTYILSAEDDSFRFSETGAAFFVDFASKHALHSNCAQYVRYSGEFHPRPKGGWQAFSDDNLSDEDVEWELVIDNNSGTYSPDPTLLPELQHLLEYNFPGFTIVAMNYLDERLVQSTEACRKYAVERRGIDASELEPHRHQDEETLHHRASTRRPDEHDEAEGAKKGKVVDAN